MKTNLILGKNTKIVVFCLLFIIIVVKVSSLNLGVKKNQLTASVNNSNVVEDLGVQFQSLVADGNAMFKDKNGNPHWFGIYNKTTDGSGRAQFLDVNLKTGSTKYFDTNKSGRGGGGAKAIFGNKFYMTVNDPCSLWEYDISAGTFTEKKSSSWVNYACGTALGDKGAQSAYTTKDGMMYFGTAIRGTVFEVNPATGNVRDFGVVDPLDNPTSSVYVYSIAADKDYIYAGMRYTGTNSWWLAIIKISDGSLSASCWKNDGLNGGGVTASTDGTQIIYRTNSGDYRVDNTNGACPTTPYKYGTTPTFQHWTYYSNIYFGSSEAYSRAPSLFGVDIDDSNISPDTGTKGLTTLKYRYPAGTGSYKKKTQAIKMMDNPIKILKAKDNTSLYLASGSYGPNALFNGKSSKILGLIGGQSVSAITPLGKHVYFSGYTSSTYRYTPSLPWTLKGSNSTTCTTASPTNPCFAFGGMGKYHYYGLAGTDGLLYVASDYARAGRTGGDIGWYTPETGKTGVLAFTCDSPAGFALLTGGTTIAYSSNSENGSFGCTNTVGKVFLFNTTTHTVTATLTPISGSDSQGKVIGTKDGGIFGVIKDFPTTGHYTLYKVDQTGKHASWSPIDVTGNIFGNTSKSDQNLLLSNDGMIHTWDSNGLLKINPNDGTRTTYASVSGISHIEFVGKDLYIATGATLRRIKGVNIDSPDKAITSFNFKNLSPAVNGIVDEKNHTINLTVPFGTKITALSPTIEITGKSISPKTGASTNFTKPVTFTVKAEDTSTQKYIVTVKVSPKVR